MECFVAVSVCFYIALPNSMVSSESILCVEKKNITVIPHIDIHQEWKGMAFVEVYFKNQGMQLRYLE